MSAMVPGLPILLLLAAATYDPSGLVNAADNQVGWLSPGVIATLYGSNLAYVTKALGASDVAGGVMPMTLPGTGLTILVGGMPAYPFYVSPTQINFLLPSNLMAGSTDLQLVLNGLAGPRITIQLGAAAPALFELDANTAIAVHSDGSVVDAAS